MVLTLMVPRRAPNSLCPALLFFGSKLIHPVLGTGEWGQDHGGTILAHRDEVHADSRVWAAAPAFA